MAKHEKAFDKGTDADKLKATSEQVQEQTGQRGVSVGPDPIIEAVEAQRSEQDEPDEERDLSALANPEYEEEFASKPVEGAVSEGGDSVPNAEPEPKKDDDA